MTAPVNTSFFADLQGLAALKSDAKAQAPAALKEAAQQFESLFTQMLLKSMRDASKSFGEDSLFGSEQADFYQDMFDDQIALHLSKGKGLGLADMLIRQLSGGVVGTGAPAGAGSATSPQQGTPAVNASSVGPQAANVGSHAPAIRSKADFVKTMWPHAEQAARQLGVDPQALLAQAALETGWGKSMPCAADGSCSYNMFGIKAGSQWSGATVNVPTLEFEDGVAVRKVDRFRAYESPAASFMDYARLIANSPRYENAVGAGGDVATFASALQQGGYATDPQYARKVLAVAGEVRALVQGEAFKFAARSPLSNDAGGV